MQNINVDKIRRFLGLNNIGWDGDILVTPKITKNGVYNYPCFKCDRKKATVIDLSSQVIAIPVIENAFYNHKYSRIFYLEVNKEKFVLKINEKELPVSADADGIQ